MRQVLDFCKERTNATELGDESLQSFCRSVREKLQNMVEHTDDGEGIAGERALHPFEIAQVLDAPATFTPPPSPLLERTPCDQTGAVYRRVLSYKCIPLSYHSWGGHSWLI